MNDLERAASPQIALAEATASGKVKMSPILAAIGIDPSNPTHQAALLACDKYGLDPLLKHIIVIPGSGPYITRDGWLHVAHRSGQFDGMEVIDSDENQTHWVAKVAVYRKDMSRPFTFIGRYPKSGRNKTYGPEMALKVAEVMALRRAFDVGGVPALEERWEPAEAELVANAHRAALEAASELNVGCTGAYDCPAVDHIHGCFSDDPCQHGGAGVVLDVDSDELPLGA